MGGNGGGSAGQPGVLERVSSWNSAFCLIVMNHMSYKDPRSFGKSSNTTGVTHGAHLS